MTRIVYEVVEHDGGWAYRVNGVFSETFSSHDLAHSAAERAANEQVVPGDPTGISYEDKDGRWHDEASPGGDRPRPTSKVKKNLQEKARESRTPRSQGWPMEDQLRSA